MQMPGRKYSSGNRYRYGFQNQETDPELWDGAIAFKYRIEDPRLNRFFSIDPLAGKYPHNSPYAFSENRLIDGIELEGLEFIRRKSFSSPLSLTQHAFATKIEKSTAYRIYVKVLKATGDVGIEALHMTLDGLGFVPGVGELADGTNAIIYTAQGDYLNASFSTISLAPIAGDLAAKGFKYALKAAGYEGKAFKSLGGATKWIKNAMDKGFKVADALQDPRVALQKALGTMGSGKAAHHLIPVEMLEKNKYIQQAVEQGFDFNGVVNGLGLGSDQHSGRHPKAYIAGIEKMVEAARAVMPKASAKEVMGNVAGDLKKMLDGTGKKVNELFTQ